MSTDAAKEAAKKALVQQWGAGAEIIKSLVIRDLEPIIAKIVADASDRIIAAIAETAANRDAATNVRLTSMSQQIQALTGGAGIVEHASTTAGISKSKTKAPARKPAGGVAVPGNGLLFARMMGKRGPDAASEFYTKYCDESLVSAVNETLAAHKNRGDAEWMGAQYGAAAWKSNKDAIKLDYAKFKEEAAGGVNSDSLPKQGAPVGAGNVAPAAAAVPAGTDHLKGVAVNPLGDFNLE